MNLNDVLLRPIVTEKSTFQSDKYNQYTFEVSMRANKILIKQAVELAFKVDVIDVHVSVMAAKRRRNPRSRSQTGTQIVRVGTRKKAVVKLAEGQSIHFFEGIK